MSDKMAEVILEEHRMGRQAALEVERATRALNVAICEADAQGLIVETATLDVNCPKSPVGAHSMVQTRCLKVVSS